jgi:UDP-N-acetyl-D-glucosamine dehydrogenase
VRRLSRALNERGRSVKGSRVLLLGLGYKRNTSDARESPSVNVAAQLVALGADVHAADPFVDDGIVSGTTRVDCSVAELHAADAVVMLTNHDAFDVKAIAEHARYVLDCRRAIPAGENVEYL